MTTDPKLWETVQQIDKRLTAIEFKVDLIWRAMLSTAGTILLAILGALLALIVR